MDEIIKNTRYVGIITLTFFSLYIIIWLWSGVRQSKRSGKIAVQVLFLFFVCWFFYGRYEYVKLVPPDHTCTLSEFINSMDSSYHITIVTIANKTYFEVIGEWSPFTAMTALFVRLASGPPGYVFNQEGYLIDWTHDRDESQRYWDKWIAPHDNWQSRKKISLEEALELMGTWLKEEPNRKEQYQ